METRFEEEEEEEEELMANPIPPQPPSPIAEPTTTSSSAASQDWSSDLPTNLLGRIFHRVSLSIPDILSFAAVCHPWRSTATSALAASPYSGPPLLLSICGLVSWGDRGPPRCILQTLNDNRPKPFSTISTEALRAKCLGCYYGHLIFEAGDSAVLINPFNRGTVRSPKFPETPSSPYTFQIGILTVPPSSPGCSLLLVASSCTLCWRIHSRVWAREAYLRYGREVSAVAFFNGKLYCLDDQYRVKPVNFDFPASWTTLELELPDAPPLHGNFKKYLVECGGELLLVLFAGVTEQSCRIDVYRLDFEGVKWKKKESLGDHCLFLDAVGNCPIVSKKPGRWGGRSNCVYVAGPGRSNWSVHPVDGSEIDAVDKGTALCSEYKRFDRWPSSVWFYPNKLL